MPSPREVLEARLQRLQEETEQTKRDLQELERICAKYEFLVIAPPSKPLRAPERISRANLARAAREAESIIRGRGHPVLLEELFSTVIVERGIEITGNDPSTSFSAAMIMGKKLHYLKDVGWWIKDVPWPPTPEDIARLNAAPINGPIEEEPEPTDNRRGPHSQKLFEAIREILKDLPGPMTFAELFERVKDASVPIGGTDERQNLASFLMKFSCFVNDGRSQGWRYVAERDFGPFRRRRRAKKGEQEAH